jgi:hypothetical protein
MRFESSLLVNDITAVVGATVELAWAVMVAVAHALASDRPIDVRYGVLPSCVIGGQR